MLRFLTHKLKTHSLNEEPEVEKTHEDHDSGTESDDESGDTNGLPGDHNTMEHEGDCEWGGNRYTGMFSLNSIARPRSGGSFDEVGPDMMVLGSGGGRDSASSQLESCYIDSALPSDSDHAYDHHSSEEELEVINSSYQDGDDIRDEVLLCGDEVRGIGSENKRKWSQVASSRLSMESTSSDEVDDEVQGLLRPLSTPVEFCTSPPMGAHKPSRSQSPPPKLFLATGIENIGGRVNNLRPIAIHAGGVFRGLRRCDQNGADHHHAHHVSPHPPATQNGLDRGLLAEPRQDGRSHQLDGSTTPGTLVGSRGSRNGRDSTSRKRHRHHNPRHIQRPWLDFEKMQQLKARSVTTWRSGGELSLYCS